MYPMVIANAWLEWVTNGIFAGLRRISLNAHMDDIFMSTGIFDIDLLDEGSETYRLTPEDLGLIIQWQDAFNARLPSGSHFALTFPFNGATVAENGGYNVDPLFIYAKQHKAKFYWESHTYTHPYLDTYTYAQVHEEFSLNIDTAKVLFGDALSDPAYDGKSCITPSITGLFNGEALRAMYDVGIRNVVGDNSRPELVPANIFHGITSTVATHGFAGMYIVPRHATEIYYNNVEPFDLMLQYNYRYHTYFGRNLTFDEMIAEQVKVHSTHLLGYRQDSFMFHQANMKSFVHNGKTTSLVGAWADALVDNLMKFTTLPCMSFSSSSFYLFIYSLLLLI